MHLHVSIICFVCLFFFVFCFICFCYLSRANSLTRVFTEMAESFLFNIVHYPDTPIGSLKTLDLLLVVAKHYDFEVINEVILS